MLNIDEIVKISLYLNAPAVSAQTYYAGLILGKSGVISAGDRVKQYTSLVKLAEDFQDNTPEYKAARAYFAQDPAPESVYVGVLGAEETPVEALAACLEKTGDFWGVFVCGATTDQIVALDTELALVNRCMQFATITSVEAATDTLAALQSGASKRTAVIVNEGEFAGAALMGRVIGLNTRNRTTAFSIAYKTLAEVTPSGYTQKQVEGIKNLGGSVYVTRGYSRKMIEVGGTGSGLRVDEVMYLDMLISDLQDKALTLFAEDEGKLPQADSTTAVFMNAFTEVFEEYVARGVLAPGIWRGNTVGTVERGQTLTKGYAMYADSYFDQSQADREKHLAVPIRAAITLAGSVESVDLSIYAQR